LKCLRHKRHVLNNAAKIEAARLRAAQLRRIKQGVPAPTTLHITAFASIVLTSPVNRTDALWAIHTP